MSNRQYTNIDFIRGLIDGTHKVKDALKLAARLASFLPDGDTKTELQTLIVNELRIDEAVLVALKAEE